MSPGQATTLKTRAGHLRSFVTDRSWLADRAGATALTPVLRPIDRFKSGHVDDIVGCCVAVPRWQVESPVRIDAVQIPVRVCRRMQLARANAHRCVSAWWDPGAHVGDAVRLLAEDPGPSLLAQEQGEPNTSSTCQRSLGLTDRLIPKYRGGVA